MTQTVFVKVIGFTDVERHALNTMFRLSGGRDTVYAHWMPDAPESPQLALVDGESYEASVDLGSLTQPGLHIIWIGAAAPANVGRSFRRPLVWADVIQAMDELFAPAEAIDFDLDLGGDAAEMQAPEMESLDTQPPDTEPSQLEEPGKRALIASADRDERLYLRAKLALAHLTQADEAETGAQALELARMNRYTVALVDFGLPDVDGWALLRELSASRTSIPHLIATKSHTSVSERVRAWFTGTDGFFEQPPDPGKLQDLLRRM
jgi:CheY-like chemotaxis protein